MQRSSGYHALTQAPAVTVKPPHLRRDSFAWEVVAVDCCGGRWHWDTRVERLWPEIDHSGSAVRERFAQCVQRRRPRLRLQTGLVDRVYCTRKSIIVGPDTGSRHRPPPRSCFLVASISCCWVVPRALATDRAFVSGPLHLPQRMRFEVGQAAYVVLRVSYTLKPIIAFTTNIDF